MWPSCAHILKPLTDHSGLKKHAHIPWIDEIQQAFDKMCVLMVADALGACPDHNNWFDIYTDASDFQLGACIVQERRFVLPLKNFEVCSLVQIFMFLLTIKTLPLTP